MALQRLGQQEEEKNKEHISIHLCSYIINKVQLCRHLSNHRNGRPGGSASRGWMEEQVSGPRLLVKKVLRAWRVCITQYQRVSRALGFATHVGAEPAGPELSGKNSHVLTAQRSLRAGRMTGEYYVKA